MFNDMLPESSVNLELSELTKSTFSFSNEAISTLSGGFNEAALAGYKNYRSIFFLNKPLLL